MPNKEPLIKTNEPTVSPVVGITLGVGQKVQFHIHPDEQLKSFTESEEQYLKLFGGEEGGLYRKILIRVKSIFPDFIYSGGGENDIIEAVDKHIKKIFNGKTHATQGPIDPYIIRLFRLNDPSRSHVIQRSGNCFLVATLYSLIQNPFFLEQLGKSLKVNGSGFSSEWNFSGPKGTHSVSVEDVGLDFSVPSISDVSDDIIEKFATRLRDQIEKQGNMSDEMRNRFFKKSQKPKKKFIKEIQDQILKGEGIFYDYWLGEERRINTILPISGPIGYRVLESIYTKAQISPIISNLFLSRVLIGDFERNIRKVSSKGGPPSVVMNTFLDDSKWKTGIIRFDSDIERALFKSLILHFGSGRIVLVAEVYKDKQEDVLIDDFLITDNHAYSVTGFHANSDTITIINPWNSSKQKDLSLEDFFRLFSGVTFAYKL